jgi:hypothetical protein
MTLDNEFQEIYKFEKVENKTGQLTRSGKRIKTSDRKNIGSFIGCYQNHGVETVFFRSNILC